MDGANAFLRLIDPEHGLSTAHRQIRLRLGEQAPDALLLPQRVTGSESLGGGVAYQVHCLCGTPHLPLKQLIGQPAELQFQTDGGVRSVCGIVTEARAGDFDGGLATYQLLLRDVLAVMEKRINTRIFRDRSELDIVQVLFDEWRNSNAVLACAVEFERDPLLDPARHPPRAQTMQYNESDAAFVRRLLRRRGINWLVRPGRSSGSTVDPARDAVPAHTLVLFDGMFHSLAQQAAPAIRYHREDATDGADVITSWTAARSLQAGSSARHGWDYKAPQGGEWQAAPVSGLADQGPLGNALAASLDDYQWEAPHTGHDADDDRRLGQLRIARHDVDTKCFHAAGPMRAFAAGAGFTLQGHPELDAHAPDGRMFIVTALTLQARNNLPEGLLARDTAAALDGPGLMQVQCTVVRRGVPLVPAFDPQRDLPHPPLQSAIVVGPPGEEVHCDALGRVKIRFPGLRMADHRHAHGAGASGGPDDSAWVRVAANWAGNGPGTRAQCGALGLPRVGSEVLVAFLGGDPDRPVILSQLYNQQGLPPELGAAGGLPGNRYLSGLKSREVGGARGNQLRLDDTPGQISAQLASEHGASQLNLGWLADPRDGGTGAPRGEGAELRSDAAVAVRGARGVLLSAHADDGADGPQLARDSLLGLSGLLHGIAQELGQLAQEHAGDEASPPRLADLVERLRQWEQGSNVASGPPAPHAGVLAGTAPDGVAFVSDDSMALGAQRKVDLISAGDTEVQAGRNLFVRAARSLSLFAASLGAKLVAARGDVLLQTHDGDVVIRSSRRISLVAAEGIELQAPSVRVVAQGAQSAWEQGRSVHRSTDEHQVWSARCMVADGGAGMPAPPPGSTADLTTDERLVLFDRQTGLPLAGRRYVARHEDGTQIEGVTDAQGRTSLLKAHSLGEVEFALFPPDAGEGAA